MPEYRYRIVNVFTTGERLSGNPLCVFEDARGLSDAAMQALAQQFNLSETTFLLPSSVALARIRIFMPTRELSFAGHPTLGSAQVARALFNGGDAFSLEAGVGPIALTALGDRWRLRANAPVTRAPAQAPADIAALLGLQAADLAAAPAWVNTGNDQMLIKLREPGLLARCRVDAQALQRLGEAGVAAKVYLWAFAAESSAESVVHARFFFANFASVQEDPGTGSACANLGGYLIASGAALPLQVRVEQGEYMKRANRLFLEVDAQQQIFVSGDVIELGRGSVRL